MLKFWAALAASLLSLPTANAVCRPDLQCHPGPSLRGGIAPSTGTLHASLILVDFPDAPAPESESTDSLYAFLAGSPEFFTSSSYSNLNLSITPHLDRFYRMPSNSDTYNYQRGLTADDHRRYIMDALAAVGSDIDFSGASVLYILPTRAAFQISFSPTAMFPVVAGDGTEIGNTVTFGQDLYDYFGFKVLNHETGHTMGLPDLYPFSGETTEFVGGFSIMGFISGQSPDYFAYHKWQLGWLRDDQVGCVSACGSSLLAITPVEVTGGDGLKLVMVPINETFSVLVEGRSGSGVDEGACGIGILAYTSDTNITTGRGPIKVIDSKPRSGGCDFGHGGELNDAPFGMGEEYEDKAMGLKITVQCKCGDDYAIRVDRT